MLPAGGADEMRLRVGPVQYTVAQEVVPLQAAEAIHVALVGVCGLASGEPAAQVAQVRWQPPNERFKVGSYAAWMRHETAAVADEVVRRSAAYGESAEIWWGTLAPAAAHARATHDACRAANSGGMGHGVRGTTCREMDGACGVGAGRRDDT